MEKNDHPRGLLLNRTEISHAFGIAKTTIDTWVRAGMPVHVKSEGRGKPAQFDTANCLEWVRVNRCNCRFKSGN